MCASAFPLTHVLIETTLSTNFSAFKQPIPEFCLCVFNEGAYNVENPAGAVDQLIIMRSNCSSAKP